MAKPELAAFLCCPLEKSDRKIFALDFPRHTSLCDRQAYIYLKMESNLRQTLGQIQFHLTTTKFAFSDEEIPNLTRCIITSNSSISIVCRVNILWLANDENRRPGRQNLGRASAALSSHLRLQFSRNPGPTLSYLNVWSFI